MATTNPSCWRQPDITPSPRGSRKGHQKENCGEQRGLRSPGSEITSQRRRAAAPLHPPSITHSTRARFCSVGYQQVPPCGYARWERRRDARVSCWCPPQLPRRSIPATLRLAWSGLARVHARCGPTWGAPRGWWGIKAPIRRCVTRAPRHPRIAPSGVQRRVSRFAAEQGAVVVNGPA